MLARAERVGGRPQRSSALHDLLGDKMEDGLVSGD